MSDTRVNYVSENWPGMLETRYELNESFHVEQTPFQAMELVESKMFGKMLVLDGMVQTTEKDEFVYHEMMTHVPMIAHGEPRKVLIIGGGDGGILREVLRHKSVEKATMVEIDGRVVEFSKEYLPTISDGAFDDSRTDLVIDDGAKFVATTDEKYDVVIVDSSDPIGPATVLFCKEFLENCALCMAERSVMSRQSGSTWMQPDEMPEGVKMLSGIFKYATGYLYSVPTYVGGLFASTYSSQEVDYNIDLPTLEKRYEPLAGLTRYYSPGVHFGAFQLPGYVKERLQ